MTSQVPGATTTTCARCGYCLTGLTSHRVCPECGLSIARSLSPAVADAQARIAGLRKLVWLCVASMLVATGAACYETWIWQNATVPPAVWARRLSECAAALIVTAVWMALARDCHQARIGRLAAYCWAVGQCVRGVLDTNARLVTTSAFSDPSAACSFWEWGTRGDGVLCVTGAVLWLLAWRYYAPRPVRGLVGVRRVATLSLAYMTATVVIVQQLWWGMPVPLALWLDVATAISPATSSAISLLRIDYHECCWRIWMCVLVATLPWGVIYVINRAGFRRITTPERS
jgi:hypothetical protein